MRFVALFAFSKEMIVIWEELWYIIYSGKELSQSGDAMDTVYTIGYTSFDIDNFIRVLKKYGVTCLVDVRSVAKSSYYKDYDDVVLAPNLKKHGILYRNYKEEFGARQENKAFYSEKGYLDFEVFASSLQFLEGVNKIKSAQKLGYKVCLMCAEKDPINCHRTILIARNLAKMGFHVEHILANEQVCSQGEIDERLLDKFFPTRMQVSLFGEDNLSDEEKLEKAYRLKNEEIGFRLEEEQ